MRTLFFLIVIWGCQGRKPVTTGREGQPLPVFNLQLMDSTSLASNAAAPQNKSVVLMFVSVHCPYCKAQLKSIRENMSALHNIHFIIASPESLIELNKFFDQQRLKKFRNITFGRDTAYYLSRYFKTTKVPFTAIYGKDKMLRHAYVGDIYADNIKRIAEQ
jgi:peroxiredoxin